MRPTGSILQLTKLVQRVRQVSCFSLKVERNLSRTQVARCDNKMEGANIEKEISGSISRKYEKFEDESSTVIFDVEEEREKFYEISDDSPQSEKRVVDFTGISPTRGASGVIEIEELVTILRKENAINVLVIQVPKSYSYVDYLVIANGKSKRHLRAIAEYVRRVYKFKTSSSVGIPAIEGEESNEWKALDLGNIALHLMSESAREMYDLETLWSVGKEYDKLSNEKRNTIVDYQSILSSLTPVEDVISNK